jgi:murein DD-endopeptidase MepM/ murein hydrolase activator NlpD
MILRLISIVLLIAAAACSRADGGAPVRDANSQLGGSVLVRQGDTAWSIAQSAGVPVRDLIEANGLRPPYHLSNGQRLFIPNLRIHRVAAGESISVIAERFGVGRFELARLNGIGPPYRIFPRQVLKIPGSGQASARQSARPQAQVRQSAVSPPSPPVRARATTSARKPAVSPAKPTRTATAPTPRTPSSSSGKLIWPVGGRVISGFGPKKGGLHNDGVNIATAAGAQVRASQGGSVVYAGNEIRGFGNLVLIRHPGGLTTAYAHLDQTLVKRGQTVARGATIATVGTSGGVDPAQLHFEIRRGRKALDPIRTLGPTPAS